MTTPAMRALRDSRPGRRVTLLASRAGAETARYVPEIDDVIVFAAPWMKAEPPAPGADEALVEELAARHFDAAVIFTVYSQSALPAAYVCYLAGVPLRLAHCRENPYHLLTDWVREREPLELTRHEVRRQLDLVASVGSCPAHERLSFAIPRRARRSVARLLAAAGVERSRPLVMAHPGATAPSRRYPPESFAVALGMLYERSKAEIVLTGSAGEAELVDRIRAATRAPSRSLAGQLDLGELGALIERSDVVLTNNTAPAHMAAALGTPVVDLYALTNPQHTPWLVEQRVLFHDVPCRYCYKSVCPAGHHECLRRVLPGDVAAAVLELLDSRPAAAPPRPLPALAIEPSHVGAP
jgi:lipopolysaccharide heptosyltransferase II